MAVCGHGFYSQKSLRALMNTIKSTTIALANNPFMYQRELSLEDRSYGYRRVVIKPYFKLLYFVDGQNVVVDEIWDTRRNPDTLKSRIKN